VPHYCLCLICLCLWKWRERCCWKDVVDLAESLASPRCQHAQLAYENI
jgi:hypothetical protein